MSAILIGYDLRRPGQNYNSLITALKAYGTWWHNLDSTWIVVTNDTVVQVRDALMPHIDSNDKLLVVKLTSEGAWVGLDANATAWLQQHL